jgi:hypothetical protein
MAKQDANKREQPRDNLRLAPANFISEVERFRYED